MKEIKDTTDKMNFSTVAQMVQEAGGVLTDDKDYNCYRATAKQGYHWSDKACHELRADYIDYREVDWRQEALRLIVDRLKDTQASPCNPCFAEYPEDCWWYEEV